MNPPRHQYVKPSSQSKYDEVNDPDFKINDTPENIAKAILQRPPKKQWDYLKSKPLRQ